jgi:catechol 2,3-dioxygenase-like lactoylglutathione lyase family enzyme
VELALSHVALLVPSVDKSASYLSSRGLTCGKAEAFEAEGTKEVYVGDYQNQSGLLLLLEPIGDGPYKRAMTKRGPSLHHIAIDVLDMKKFTFQASQSGWQLHPVSNDQTSWFFQKGLPLLEVNEKKTLSTKPLKISELQISLPNKALSVLNEVLGKKISYGDELRLVVDGVTLLFSRIVNGR